MACSTELIPTTLLLALSLWLCLSCGRMRPALN